MAHMDKAKGKSIVSFSNDFILHNLGKKVPKEDGEN